MIEVCYKVKDKIFNDGELVAVRWKDPFSDKIVDYVGRIIPSTLTGELRLDISTRYNSHIIDITLKEIININEVGGIS